MALSAKFVRRQLKKIKPLMEGATIQTARQQHDMIGNLMVIPRRWKVSSRTYRFSQFTASMIYPLDETREGIILYLHGGGYACGGLDYARAFGTVLANECSVRVFCPAYRLAPENRFPAALEDALAAYRYLLDGGYDPAKIILCGESAGGGLLYSLCLKLKDEGLPMPGGAVAISPWTDLTLSGESYSYNEKADPTMSRDKLKLFAQLYADDRNDPLVSPLFGDLEGLPPSLIFVGGSEIMLEDSKMMHQKLLSAGCQSKLIVAPEMWHGYVLYGLKEFRSDFKEINAFLDVYLPYKRKLRWMRLDNAAKIYPAAYRHNRNHTFRLSATLVEDVDVPVLQSALDITVRRFPSIAVRLRRGLFWYYLEEIPRAPEIMEEKGCPLMRMPFENIRKCAFRVLVYRGRIAVEFFHALTDGSGGMVFLKTLVAEYLKQKYGAAIPFTDGVLNRLETPDDEELEDSYLKYAGKVTKKRTGASAYRLRGTPDEDGFLRLTTMMTDVSNALNVARSKGITLTALMCSVLIKAIYEIQNESVPISQQKHVLIQVPVNLRNLFKSRTVRNFSLYIKPGIDPRLGEWSFDEICRKVYHSMAAEITAKEMAAGIASNVRDEQALIIRVMPLFIKNAVLKAAYNIIGEGKECLTLSNLGAVKIPEEMKRYVTRMDFILGARPGHPYNCAMISYGDTLYLNIARIVKEPQLELKVYQILRDLGIKIKVESNYGNAH
ncbi:MAG: alpha/beta hydrolase [Eubacteriales bacterium]